MARKLKVKDEDKLCPHCNKPILIDFKDKTVRIKKDTIKLLVEMTKNQIGVYNGEMIDARIQELCRMFYNYQRHNCEQVVTQLRNPNVTIVIKGEQPYLEVHDWLKP